MPPKAKADEVDEVKAAGVCGHINKQHYGYDGKLEDLACALPGGHAGNHQAPYKRKVGTPVTNEKGMVVKMEYAEDETQSTWSDAAGVPAEQVHVGKAEQMTLYQRDLVLQIIQKNAKLTVEDAIAIASQSEEWNQRVR